MSKFGTDMIEYDCPFGVGSTADQEGEAATQNYGSHAEDNAAAGDNMTY
jgi:hypothetical protein